jgi:hypothetical protein
MIIIVVILVVVVVVTNIQNMPLVMHGKPPPRKARLSTSGKTSTSPVRRSFLSPHY